MEKSITLKMEIENVKPWKYAEQTERYKQGENYIQQNATRGKNTN